ncbi:DUF1499 domain-containing protein [Arenibaculum pallidiluteum]|uniref:DUF1499 domain-containing protein n=1 Tax=Arenibaculum pallidiluteum TaxID=2812559 RepID=UPI001A9685EE|nr:DUF1499 domain-containing protein [Arenibaculum pallidiluteum]
MNAKRPAAIALAILAVPVLAYGGLAVAVGRDGVWAALFGAPSRLPVDFTRPEALADGPPNRVLMCPPGYCAGREHATSPEFTVAAEDLRAAWERAVDARPNIRKLGGTADGLQADYEARTPLLRFPDTITVRFIPLAPGRSSLAAFSRSHYGHSDFGVNEARLRALLQTVEEEIRR